MKTFFKDLLEYHHHCNRALTDVFMTKPATLSERSIKIFSHILNAHQIWNNRILPKEKPYGVWEIQPIESFPIIDERNFNHSLEILETISLEDQITYANSTGTFFTHSAQVMLFQALNHGTYHRGQIAADFRANGIEPIPTDYILYKRK
jgi:uncharacterized damage-inducible protein DinB